MSDRRTAMLEAAARVIARRGVRGLRVEELAAEAGVSTALIYYHFKDRSGILRAALEFISDRAERYTVQRKPESAALEPRAELEQRLLLELQDTALVRENSICWGELKASAVFDPDLREQLAEATAVWVQEITELLAELRPSQSGVALTSCAERLTALLEGLSMRWLSGPLPLEHARELLCQAVDAELDHLRK